MQFYEKNNVDSETSKIIFLQTDTEDCVSPKLL